MKVHLLFKDRDFNPGAPTPPQSDQLVQDLELTTIINAMSGEDTFIQAVVKTALLSSCTNVETLKYRQDILRDSLKHPEVIREMYALTLEAIEGEKKFYFSIFTKYPAAILHSSIEAMRMFIGVLHTLRSLAEKNVSAFQSEGFKSLFSMLIAELGASYFNELQDHLKKLQFPGGILISATVGKGLKGTNYVLRKNPTAKKGLFKTLFDKKSPTFSFTVPDQDEAAARSLSELRDRGIHLAANALAQSRDHILGFFTMLRTELAFYVACVFLQEKLTSFGLGVSIPELADPEPTRRSFQGLYDVALALTLNHGISGNTVNADARNLIIVTGANQGGKSTFLRSLGQAQLMLQCGMFVGGQSFSGSICGGIFTHFKRKEDAQMKSGKLDEEMDRMDAIIRWIQPHSMVLFNESFSSTNEREGSELSRQISQALVDRGNTVVFVTHQFDFAMSMYEKNLPTALFLKAERLEDSKRTFRMIEGAPEARVHGEDLYRTLFSEPVQETQNATTAVQ